MATKANPADQVVSTNDESLLDSVFSSIDKRRYKKALQTCELLLNRYPTNGELVSAKGLCLTSMSLPNEDENYNQGLALMKQGLMFNLKSSRSWQLQGVFFRNQKKYAEALKFYTQVHKLCSQTGLVTEQLLRDITQLQAQCGQWEQYMDSRREMLLMPDNNVGMNWPGFAVGAHLAGRPEVALAALRNHQVMFREQIKNSKTQYDPKIMVENNEMSLYGVEIFYQNKQYQEAYDELLANKPTITDLLHYRLYESRLLLKLGRGEEVKAITLTILQDNCEQLDVILLYFLAHGISLHLLSATTDQSYSQLMPVFTDLFSRFPKSQALIKLFLQTLSSISDLDAVSANQNDQKHNMLQVYLLNNLRKGVPSLFKTLRQFYSKPQLVDYIQQQLLSFQDNLLATHTFFAPEAATPEQPSKTETPTALLSTYIFLAQHYDYLGDSTTALAYLDKAQQHTPTFIDLYVLRAQVFKHLGAFEEAFYWMNFARELDTADRYLNNKCIEFAYLAGHDDEAEQLTQMFIQEEDGIFSYQFHQQASWWFTAVGRSRSQYYNLPSLNVAPLALVNEFFSQYHDSMNDYHHYCMRKNILRAYTGMMTFLTCSQQHRLYIKAVVPLVQNLIAIYQQALVEQRINAQQQIDQATLTSQLTAQNNAIVAHFDSRPLHRLHADAVQKKIAKLNKAEEGQDERYAPHHGSYSPDWDFYGLYHSNKIAAQPQLALDFAVELISTVLSAYKNTRNWHTQSNQEQAQQYNGLQKEPLVVILLLAVHVFSLAGKSLKALSLLKQAQDVVKHVASALEQDEGAASVSLTAKERIVKQQYASLSWFAIDNVPYHVMVATLPVYYKAQLFVEQVVLSQQNLVQTAPKALAPHVTAQFQRAVDQSVLFNDIQAAFSAQLERSRATDITSRIIMIASVLIAAHSAQVALSQTVLDTVIAQIGEAVTAAASLSPSSSAIRVALHSLVIALRQYIGVRTPFTSHPIEIPSVGSNISITGVIIQDQDLSLATPDQREVLRLLLDQSISQAAVVFPQDDFFAASLIRRTYQLTRPVPAPSDGK